MTGRQSVGAATGTREQHCPSGKAGEHQRWGPEYLWDHDRRQSPSAGGKNQSGGTEIPPGRFTDIQTDEHRQPGGLKPDGSIECWGWALANSTTANGRRLGRTGPLRINGSTCGIRFDDTSKLLCTPGSSRPKAADEQTLQTTVRAPAWPQRKNLWHSLEVCHWPNGPRGGEWHHGHSVSSAPATNGTVTGTEQERPTMSGSSIRAATFCCPVRTAHQSTLPTGSPHQAS